MKSPIALCLLLVCLCAAPLAASAPKKPAPKKDAAKKSAPALSEEEEAAAAAAEYESKLDFRRGRVELPGGFAALDVPEGFRYLPAEQADKFLVEAWGNPPGTKTLGMLFPSDTSPLGEDGWGVVITYNDDGHVDDADAAGIDYDALLKEMKQDSAERNKERTAQGYEAATLVGWAAAPRYDSASHKLYWAREISFDGAREHTLNYDIRVLGREGVLSFNAVAGMSKLSEVEGRMKEVMGFSDFSAGRRYADYREGNDRLAAYGIGALVAGNLAAKAGLFKLALGALLAAKKFVALALAGLVGFVAKLFRRKKS
ncbi:MAG TPA: DUF2167 domain-containing protein [Pyrinomonadaceae bacterium]|nr:DUF2167 domain-containing protein [Pyrinomonadaceae bacterium]